MPLWVRAEIASKFGIAKVGPTHVVNDRIESDGYRIEDVEHALNVKAMQVYTDLKTSDVAVLFEATTAKAEGRVVPEEEVAAIVEEPVTLNETVIEPAPKKRGRKAKAA